MRSEPAVSSSVMRCPLRETMARMSLSAAAPVPSGGLSVALHSEPMM